MMLTSTAPDGGRVKVAYQLVNPSQMAFPLRIQKIKWEDVITGLGPPKQLLYEGNTERETGGERQNKVGQL